MYVNTFKKQLGIYLYLPNETPNTKCSKIAEQHVEASDEVLSRKFIFKQN